MDGALLMKRLFVSCFLIGILYTNVVYSANATNLPNSERRPFEDYYYEFGYKSVEDALKECENHFHRDLKLPTKLPPVEFTHHFGRFNDVNGETNDGFQVEFLNEKLGENHYMIKMLPDKHKMNFSNKREVIRTYKLKDGTEAVYLTAPRHHGKSFFNVLVFEKNSWQYVLSIDSRIENKVSAKVLVEIAESVKLTYPAKSSLLLR
jgi:hypothetical protein